LSSADSKRVLILTSDMGYGHRSAARAVEAALHRRYPGRVEAEIVNAFDHRSVPSRLKEDPGTYDRVVREYPELVQRGYRAVNRSLPTTVFELGLSAVLGEAVSNIVETMAPDVIVVTNPFFLAPLKANHARGGRRIPVVTTVTDMGDVLAMWFNDISAYTLVPTQRVYELALEHELPSATVRMTGIPVNPALGDDTRSKAEVRSSLQLDPDRTTVLVVGSKRVNNLIDAVTVLNHSNLPAQLIVAAGGDDETYRALQAMEWHLPVCLFDFADDMPSLMRAADVLVGKAGGLIVNETLAAGLPMLLIDVIEGQESGNAAFVTENGAGAVVKEPLLLLETVHHWLSGDQHVLREHADNARMAGRPRAAYDAAELAWGLAQPQATSSA
jgi:1,2-diacylglycerol 3-beta-galactosyltransferase